MSGRVDVDAVGRFRAALAARLGLAFDDAKTGLLADALRARLDATSLSAGAYLEHLEHGAPGAEIAALARALTVGETYFFRHHEQFRAFADMALTRQNGAATNGRRLRILSAGCASGEEAYTLAILVRELLREPGPEVSIVGLDVNPAALAQARDARFSPWALRVTPEDVTTRWFRPTGRDFVLADDVRTLVRFEEDNLAAPDPRWWQPAIWDVIFLRNVLMYFTPEQARGLVARIATALRPGGYLFLGHAETLRGLSHAFHLCHTHDTFYYERRDAATTSEPLATTPAAAWTSPAVADATWFDTIQQASSRIARLAAAPAAARTRARGAHASVPAATWDLSASLELFRRERYAEALEGMDRLPPAAAGDRDVLLLRAVLLIHAGRPAHAEDACRRLLARDDLSAGAHYVLALCRESAGDAAGATHHDQIAVYLDPAFAMPHLHLGLLARRRGDHAAARRALDTALVLLEREDAPRILLFGGGFGRDALGALCRAELRACGEAP